MASKYTGHDLSLNNDDRTSNNMIKTEEGNSSNSNGDVYKTLYKFKKGHAFIFNHTEFQNYNSRENAVNDCEEIEKVLCELDFEIEVYHNLTCDLIREILCEIVLMDHSEMDCILIVVLTYGNKEQLHAYDQTYSPAILWESFTNETCPTLAGKPKLVFIQASRGERINNVRQNRSTTINVRDTYRVPIIPDVLVTYSIYPGVYSFGSINNGSMFVRYLCKELREYGRQHDIITILTSINRSIATGYENYNPNSRVVQCRKIIGIFISTLTKRLCFFQPNN